MFKFLLLQVTNLCFLFAPCLIPLTSYLLTHQLHSPLRIFALVAPSAWNVLPLICIQLGLCGPQTTVSMSHLRPGPANDSPRPTNPLPIFKIGMLGLLIIEFYKFIMCYRNKSFVRDMYLHIHFPSVACLIGQVFGISGLKRRPGES